MRPRFSFLLFFLGMAVRTAEALPEVRVELQPREAALGDRLTLTVTARHDSATLVSPPEWPNRSEAWGILESHPVQAERSGSAGTIEERFVLDVAFYDLKVTEWPAGRMAWRDGTGEHTLDLPPQPISVRNVAPESGETIQAAKPQAELHFPGWYWVLGVAVLLSAALGAWALRRYWLNRPVPAIAIGRAAVPPHEEALAALKRIERERYPARGQTQRHYFEISETLKRYLERRFGFPALEATTAEIAAALPDYLPQPIRCEQFVTFLQHTDHVKFARLDPGGDRAEALLIEARELVAGTAQVSTGFSPDVPETEAPP